MKTKAKRPWNKGKKKTTLKDFIAKAQEAGVDVQISMKEKMPQHFPDDHPHVTALLNESERITRLGIKWGNSQAPNPIATEMCFKNGWAHNLSAAWLRCYLKGELAGTKPPTKTATEDRDE